MAGKDTAKRRGGATAVGQGELEAVGLGGGTKGGEGEKKTDSRGMDKPRKGTKKTQNQLAYKQHSHK